MENNTFKSVAFGGFDKQDVIHYIEQSSREAAEAQERLRQENDTLRGEIQALRGQVEDLRAQLEQAGSQREQMQSLLLEEQAARQALEQERQDTESLAAELKRLRPDAESYAQFRDRVGDIECDAHKRAAELESTTMAQLNQVVRDFRTQYTELMSTFEAAAAHVTGELRKVEVNLSQLPRTMDASGAKLGELAALLERE